MNKKHLALCIAILLIFTQFLSLSKIKVSAKSEAFSAQVVIEGFDGVIAQDTTSKSNAFDALSEVLTKHNFSLIANDSTYGKYIDGVKNLNTGVELKGSKDTYWMYAVNRNGSYVDIALGISEFILEPGDKLILYYADSNTVLANKIDFSTKAELTPITISLNSYNSWTLKTIPISNVSVRIDGLEQKIDGNNIVLKDGLKEGKHTIELSDYKTTGCPKVVEDSFDFYINFPEVSVRIEGLNGTITEDTASGKNVMEVLEKVLQNKKLSYKNPTGNYITSINGLSAGDFGEMSGWMFYIKGSKGIVSPEKGMNDYKISSGDSIVVYFGDMDTTMYANSINFSPKIVKEGEPFIIQFGYNHFDFIAGKIVNSPIKNAIINIDSLNYISNEKGEIFVPGLITGEHSYMITGYNINKLPSAVMDRGVFTIDNINPIEFNYNDSEFINVNNKDNTRIIKNIDVELKNTTDFVISSRTSPWAIMSAKKLGFKLDDSYIKESLTDINSYGIKNITNTELEKLIICLSASDYSPYDFEGIDLVSELLNRDINNFLLNDCIFGLLTYDWCSINDTGYKISKQIFVNSILSKFINNDKYGWSLMGSSMDPDITGAAISALSPFYKDNISVEEAVNKAVSSLSAIQDKNGYIPSSFGYSSETQSFVILGLTSIGINPEGIQFTKTNGDLVSALLSFRGNNGGFKHSLDGINDGFASEEALRALVALKQYKISGMYDFYKGDTDLRSFPVYPYIPNINQNSIMDNSQSVKNENITSINNTLNLTRNTNVDIKNSTTEQTSKTSEVSSIENQFNYNTLFENNPSILVNAIKSVAANTVIKVDATLNSVIDKSIFEALRGQERSIIFNQGKVSWYFNGKDITSNAKDINISLNSIPTYADDISLKYKDLGVFIISFKNNDTLPGKAEVKLQPDSKWLAQRNKSSIYLYYYNPISSKAELVEGPLNLDDSGYIKIHLTHCSDYFLCDKSSLQTDANENSKVSLASKRGVILASCMIGIGILIIFILLLKRNKNK